MSDQQDEQEQNIESEPEMFACEACGYMDGWVEGGFEWSSIKDLANGTAFPLCRRCHP